MGSAASVESSDRMRLSLEGLDHEYLVEEKDSRPSTPLDSKPTGYENIKLEFVQ